MVGWGLGSRPRFHEGGLFAGTRDRGMGPRIREDNGGRNEKGVFHGGRVAGEGEFRQWGDVRVLGGEGVERRCTRHFAAPGDCEFIPRNRNFGLNLGLETVAS